MLMAGVKTKSRVSKVMFDVDGWYKDRSRMSKVVFDADGWYRVNKVVFNVDFCIG